MQDQKAESLVCLPGFSLALATEVKSKKYAFKIFNPGNEHNADVPDCAWIIHEQLFFLTGTMFYFACETKDELNKWLNTARQSATAAYGNHESPSKDSSPISKGNIANKNGKKRKQTMDRCLISPLSFFLQGFITARPKMSRGTKAKPRRIR